MKNEEEARPLLAVEAEEEEVVRVSQHQVNTPATAQTPPADEEKAILAASYAAAEVCANSGAPAQGRDVIVTVDSDDSHSRKELAAGQTTPTTATSSSACALANCPCPSHLPTSTTATPPPISARKRCILILVRIFVFLFVWNIFFPDTFSDDSSSWWDVSDSSTATAGELVFPHTCRRTDPLRAATLHNQLLSLLDISTPGASTTPNPHFTSPEWLTLGTSILEVSPAVKALPTFAEEYSASLDSPPNYHHLYPAPEDEPLPDYSVRDTLSPALQLFLDMIHVYPTSVGARVSSQRFNDDIGITPYATVPNTFQLHQYTEWDAEDNYPHAVLLYPNSFVSQMQSIGGLFYDNVRDLARWIDVMEDGFPSAWDVQEDEDPQGGWRPLDDILEEWVRNFVEGRWVKTVMKESESDAYVMEDVASQEEWEMLEMEGKVEGHSEAWTPEVEEVFRTTWIAEKK